MPWHRGDWTGVFRPGGEQGDPHDARRRPHGVRGDRGERWSRCFQLRAKLTGRPERALACWRSCAPMPAPSAVSTSRSSRLRAFGPLSDVFASFPSSALLPKAAGDQWYSVSSSILRTTPQPQAAVQQLRTGASARRHMRAATSQTVTKHMKAFAQTDQTLRTPSHRPRAPWSGCGSRRRGAWAPLSRAAGRLTTPG